MIVARFCDKSGNAIIAAGSSRVERYSGDEGWFPIESFNFGFVPQQDDPKDGGTAGKMQPSGGAKTGGVKPTSSGSGGQGGKSPKDFDHLSIEKQIDTVTCLLMVLAMRERKSKKGADRDKESKLEADIHVVSSVQISDQVPVFNFTSLMIHLEAVNIQGWGIRGSGDGRPTESVQLRYDRALMLYVRTPDARNVDPVIGPKGWDQTNGVELTEKDWPKSKWGKYL